MRPIKFQVNWPFGSGEEAKIFKMATVAAILDFRSERLAILIYQSPEYVLTSFESNDLSVLEKNRKNIFKMAALAAIFDFRLEQFSNF